MTYDFKPDKNGYIFNNENLINTYPEPKKMLFEYYIYLNDLIKAFKEYNNQIDNIEKDQIRYIIGLYSDNVKKILKQGILKEMTNEEFKYFDNLHNQLVYTYNKFKN